MTISALTRVIFCSAVLADWDADGLVYSDANGNAIYQNEIVDVPGHDVKENVKTAPPHTYIDLETLPMEFDWGNIDGTSYLTQSVNQHIPQYCGSCWAFGTLSALADRVKIQRLSRAEITSKPDISLAVQVVLNCGSDIAGSCYGGSPGGVYQWVMQSGIPFSTCQPYLACSSDSSEGFCADVDSSCSAINTCRTCSTFESYGGGCYDIGVYPNLTIAEYGKVTGAESIKAEIFARGPVAVEVNATPLLVYTGGIINMPDESKGTNHVVSIIGWGHDEEVGQYWKVRNSWGEYWGELGFFKIVMGGNQLGIEQYGYWAVPKTWTERNVPCFESGINCQGESLSTHGWNEGQYKENVGRYLIDNPTDFWRWDSGNCITTEQQKVSFALEANTLTVGRNVSYNVRTLIIAGILLSFFSSICGGVTMLLWNKRKGRGHIRLPETGTSSGLSLQVKQDKYYSDNLYVVDN